MVQIGVMYWIILNMTFIVALEISLICIFGNSV